MLQLPEPLKVHLNLAYSFMHWSLFINNFQLCEISSNIIYVVQMCHRIPIGSGNFGVVYKEVDDLCDNAVKVLYEDFGMLKKTKGLKSNNEDIWREWSDITFLSGSHANIVSVFEVTKCDSHVHIRMELMEYNLKKLLQEYPQLSLDKRLCILHNVSSGIDFLHSRRTPHFHGNLHSKNVFITDTFLAKIGDLMPSRYIQKKIIEGKLRSYSPWTTGRADIVTCASGQSLDIFAFGLVACHAITKRVPMPENEDPDEIKRYKKYLDLIGNESCLNLVKQCLHGDSRPPISFICSALTAIMNGKDGKYVLSMHQKFCIIDYHASKPERCSEDSNVPSLPPINSDGRFDDLSDHLHSRNMASNAAKSQ